ncbi:DUF6274 family protein [Streptomyces pimonensis]|uniref:DUF6274 family protein n=1 Tax=Streptomyces pimonensis TaxID=2860288 RepID=UPI003526CA23
MSLAPGYSKEQDTAPCGPLEAAYGGIGRARDTGAALYAHLSAASSYRHLTRHRPARHRLLRPGTGSVPRPSDTSRPAGNNPAPTPVSSSACAACSTSRLVCDGCHRMSSGKCGTYTSPTTGQFNMCNCTTRRGTPRSAHRRSPARPRSPASPRTERPPGLARAGPPPYERTKRSRWTRRSPARSTTHPCSAAWKALIGLGEGPVGAVPASLGARVPGRLGRWGTSRSGPVHAVVQASLRCCGMPASSARTSASR